MKSINYFNFLAMALALFSLIAPSLQEGQSNDEEVKRNTHNILRFGRAGPMNNYPFRVGRASGHNIMRFGRSMPVDGQSDLDSLASLWATRDTSQMDQSDNNEGQQQMIPSLALYVSSSTSSFPTAESLSSSPVGPSSAEDKSSVSSSSINAVEETSSRSSSSSQSAPALRSLSKRNPQSLGSRFLLPHLYLSSLYTPYPRLGGYSFNKKADLRDRNNFIHFG